MLMWLDGYYSEADAPPVVDFDTMTENSLASLANTAAKIPVTA